MRCLKDLFVDLDSFDGQLSKVHPDDAGMDIRASETVNIPVGKWVTIRTGLRIALPGGTAGIIKGRSGLAIRHGIECSNAGVIDEGFRGEIMVRLGNMGEQAHTVIRGDRIAQLLIIPIVPCQLIHARPLPASSTRGENGYGSSGLN